MFKIAICGKANSGKNTIGKLLEEELARLHYIKCMNGTATLQDFREFCFIAFSDPIKEIVRLMFPQVKKEFLYGASKFRSEIIPGAFKDGQPLTIRQLLIDLGTGVGRSYNDFIWLNVFNNTFKKCQKKNAAAVIVTDVRFRNEFDHLKKLGFSIIKLSRKSNVTSNDATETNQDSIKDDEFDFIINNDGSLDDLKKEVLKIAIQLKV